MTRSRAGRLLLVEMAAAFAGASNAAGDIERGAAASRACMAFHSFAPGRQLTGPSLAGVWGRRAGSVEGFGRYSDALKRSEIVWNEKTLDAWLRDPQVTIPGNAMPFGVIAEAGERKDLLAYLEAVSKGRVSAPDRGPPDLKRAGASRQVSTIRYCGDAYRLVTADGRTSTWWEFNLRFKTDGSANGPAARKPVLVGNGMQGDRAALVFSRPEEISALVRRECP